MSKVTIQGNASGTGTFTIAAPNSNTDRTFNLPDHTGTVLASDSITVDETNGRLGIGTTTPSVLLHLSSGGGNMFQLTSSHVTKTWMEASAGNGDMWRLGTVDSNPDVRLEAMYSTGDIKFITNSAERMRIESSGAVTKSSQPAFLATFDTAGGDQTLTSGSSVALKFDSEVYDVGSNFNTSSYTFTAPIDGIYVLTFMVRVDVVDHTASYYRADLNTSNRDFLNIFDTGSFDSVSSYQSFGVTAVADMDSGDVATARIRQQGGTNSHVEETIGYSWFSGYLLG